MSGLNDPRVFFAAERTLMAWNRTGLTLKPVEIPMRYCIWSGIAMNLSVVGLGIALMVYLFSGL